MFDQDYERSTIDLKDLNLSIRNSLSKTMSLIKRHDHKVSYGVDLICFLSLSFWLLLIEEIILKKTT